MEGQAVSSSIPSRVLVVSDLPSTAGALAARLERFGLTTTVAPGADAARAVARGGHDAVVLDAAHGESFDVVALAQELRAALRPQAVCILAITPEALDETAHGGVLDAMMIAPAYPAQIAARLRQAARLNVMEDEIRLRARSLSARGVTAPSLTPEPQKSTPITALYVGEPARDYLAIDRALAHLDGSLFASFSTFAAFDFLHETEFDAVVLNALGDDDTAFTICSALRRNTRLFHLPTLILADMQRFRRAEEAFARGASDIIPADAEPEVIAARVATLARERRRREELRAAFSAVRPADVTDTPTGLANAEFFVAHAQLMAQRAQSQGRPLSVLVMRADAPEAASRAGRVEAYNQFGAMMRRLVRVEDFAGRLDTNVFAVATPGCDYDAARTAADRLEAVGECTAFDGDEQEEPFQLTLAASIAELQTGETGRGVLVRAINGFRAAADAKAG